MVKYLLPLLIILTIVHAGILNANGRVIQEFTSAEAFYKFSNTGDVKPSQMLRKNVESAIASALARKQSQTKDIMANLQSSDIQFEKAVGTQIVYAVYQDFYFEFRYSNDPTKFHLIPTDHKVWKKPVELKKQTELNSSTE